MPRNTPFSKTEALLAFVSKVEIATSGCWLWRGALQPNGYGVFKFNGRRMLAHRVAHLLFIGPIPSGLTIDHVKARGCTSTACVNPAHLEAVTQRVNNLRGEGLAAQRARQTHCKRGHHFDAENTMRRADGTRACRACQRMRKRAAR